MSDSDMVRWLMANASSAKLATMTSCAKNHLIFRTTPDINASREIYFRRGCGRESGACFEVSNGPYERRIWVEKSTNGGLFRGLEQFFKWHQKKCLHKPTSAAK